MDGIQRKTLDALTRRNELLEESLDLEYRGERKPRRTAPPPLPPSTKRIQSGGADVRPRHINTD